MFGCCFETVENWRTVMLWFISNFCPLLKYCTTVWSPDIEIPTYLIWRVLKKFVKFLRIINFVNTNNNYASILLFWFIFNNYLFVEVLAMHALCSQFIIMLYICKNFLSFLCMNILYVNLLLQNVSTKSNTLRDVHFIAVYTGSYR